MKYLGVVLSLIFSLVPLCLYTQKKPDIGHSGQYYVSGKLIDRDTEQPIEYAAVAIYHLPDSTLVTGCVTNRQGDFTINNLGNGIYFLRINYIGYANETISIEIKGNSVILPVPVKMRAVALSIEAITVNSTKKEKQQSIEKTTINVSKNIASVSGNITEVLKGQAGVIIDNEENLYIRGNKNTLLLMDGIPTTLSSLNSIPSTNVENIEIITNPSAKYDAEGTGGIINIITKRSGSSGISGRAILNYNFEKAINGGLNLHYSKGHWDLDLGYNGKYERYKTNSTLEREMYTNGVEVRQQMHSVQLSRTDGINLMVNYKPSKKNLYTFGVKAIFPRVNNVQKISGVRRVNESEESFNRLNDVSWNREMFESLISYKHIFQKDKNELSFDASFSRNRGRRPAKYYIENELLQRSEGGGYPTNFAIQADYLKSVATNGLIEIGVKTTSRYNNFNYKFYNLNTLSNDWIIDSSFSNDLEFREFVHSFYSIYTGKPSSKFEYKLGARVEYNISNLHQLSTNEKIHNEYRFPFPFLQLKYQLNDKEIISASINRRVTRPAFPQINPFISIIDETTFETGNKRLSPEILDKAELNYSLINNRDQLRLNLFASTTKDFITQISTVYEENKLMLTYANGDRQNKIGFDIDYLIKFGKNITLNPVISAFYTNSKGSYNETDLSADDFAWSGSIKGTIKPEKRTDMQIFVNYNSPVLLPQFSLKEIYYADFSVKRVFKDDRLSVSLTLTDIFNTRKWNIESDNLIYRLKNYSKNQTRVLWLGLTLNFNSYKANKPSKNSESEIDNSVIKLGN